MCNFIQDCLSGNALLDEIDDYIDQWHEGDSEIPLHSYLGMSHEEYNAWLKSPDSLAYIVTAHKRGMNFKDTVANAATMAARSEVGRIPEIKNWLNEQHLDV